MAIRLLSSENINGNLIVTGAVQIPASADGNKFTITSSATSNNNIIEMGQLGSDGFLDVSAAGGNIVSHLSGYTGYATYFLSDVGIGTDSTTAPLTVHGQQKWYTTAADNNELRGFFNPGGSGDPAVLSLYQSNASTVGVELKALGDSWFNGGDLGVGIINPDSRFTVSSSTANNVANFKSSDGTAYIAISDNSSSTALGNQIGVVGDSMYFATADSEKLRIDTSGVVYIMGATPSVNNSFQLQYNSTAGTAEIYSKSTGGNTSFEFYTSDGGVTSKKLTIANDGTSTLEGHLYLKAAANQGQLFFGTNNDYEIFGGGMWGYLGFASPTYYRFFSNGTDIARITTDGITLGDGSQRNITGPTNQSLGLFARPNNASEGIIFSTDGGTTTEMFIQDGGRVNIGPVNSDLPSALNIVPINNYDPTGSGGRDTGGILIRGGTTGDQNNTGGIGFALGTGTAGISGYQNGSDADRVGLKFFTHGSGTGSAASGLSMIIKSGGEVGINSDDPGQKLAIEGDGTANESVLRVNNQGQFSSRIWLRNAGQSGYIFNSGGTADTLAAGIAVQGFGMGINNNSPIQFYNGSAASVKLSIDHDGVANFTGPVIAGTTSDYTDGVGAVVGNSSAGDNGGIVDLHANGSHRYYTRIAHGATGSGSAGYWHIKTNMVPSASIMFLAKFYGYVYGQSSIVDLQHSGYAYAGSNTVIAQGTVNNGSTSAMSSAIYLTSNLEVCFRIDLNSSTYYAGLWMDVGLQNPTGGTHILKILGSTFSTTTNYYT
jgi:hypothetical protein